MAAIDFQPLVSVIVPCYNQGRYLAQALDSLSAQRYRNWECIVVNDGSTDATRAVAAQYARTDPRIRSVDQANRGLAAARNRGIDEAHGAYIQFLDADDVLDADKIFAQLEALPGPGVQRCVAYCDYRFSNRDDPSAPIDRKGFEQPRFRSADRLAEIAARWEVDLSIPVHCFLFDARLFRDDGIRFDQQVPNHEDWDCWLTVFARDPLTVLVPRRLATYRVGSSSMSRDERLMSKGLLQVCSKHRRLPATHGSLGEILRARARRERADLRRRLVQQWYWGLPDGLVRALEARVPWRIQCLVRNSFSTLGKP